MFTYLSLLSLWLVLATAVEIKKIPVRGVSAVVGGVADLPCEVSHPPEDTIILLLWFRDGLTTPIYRYDSRRAGQVDHWSDSSALGTRANLDVTVHPAMLRVSSLTLKDEGFYLCRVDFKLQPTKTTRVNLTVVVPPTGVSIYVGAGSAQPVTGTVGPYMEGTVIELTCVAQGGKPPPRVVWYRDTLILDDIMDSEAALDNTTNLYPSTTSTTLTQGPEVGANTSKGVTFTLTPGPPSTTASTTLKMSSESSHMLQTGPHNTHQTGSVNMLQRGPHNALQIGPHNTLRLGPLTRNDLQLLLTCEALNNNQTMAVSSVVTLDMRLPPLSVEILSPPPYVTSGQEYEVICEVRGARPPPTVTWWQGSNQVLQAVPETTENGNLTTSRLTLTPGPQDDGVTLKCIAESYATNTVLQDAMTLIVHYRPTAIASFGSSLNADNIKEGDDVYFECDVAANPRATRVSWRLNNEALSHNVSAGVIVSNQTLVLQSVVRAWAGLYSCHAHNSVGDGRSNTLRLDVKYAPVCAPNQVTTYAVGRYEDAEVTCSVDANPAHATFQWTFNNTADTIDVPQGRFSSASTLSVITYTPMTSLDYGTLLCWASNHIGTQRVPCVFHIVPAGKPDAPRNCTVAGSGGTRTSVRIACNKESGGSSTYLLQAKMVGGSHALNVSSATPVFLVEGLRPGKKYNLYITAHNDKGMSSPAHLTVAAHGSVYQLHDGPSEAEVRDGGKTSSSGGEEPLAGVPYLRALSLPTLMPAALGVGAGLIIIIIILIILITFRTRHPRPPRPEAVHLRSPSDHSIASQEKSPSGQRSPPTLQERCRSPQAGGASQVILEEQGVCHERDRQVETETDRDPDVIPYHDPLSTPVSTPATIMPPPCYHYPSHMTSPRYGRLGIASPSEDPFRGPPRDPLRAAPLPHTHPHHHHHHHHHHPPTSSPRGVVPHHPPTTSPPRGVVTHYPPPPSGPPPGSLAASAPLCRHPATLDPHRLPYPGVEGARLPPPPSATEVVEAETKRHVFAMEASSSVCEDDTPSTPLLRKRESSV